MSFTPGLLNISMHSKYHASRPQLFMPRHVRFECTHTHLSHTAHTYHCMRSHDTYVRDWNGVCSPSSICIWLQRLRYNYIHMMSMSERRLCLFGFYASARKRKFCGKCANWERYMYIRAATPSSVKASECVYTVDTVTNELGHTLNYGRIMDRVWFLLCILFH